MLESLFTKVAGLRTTYMFFCEYCEIFKSTYFEEHLQTAVQVLSCEFCENFKSTFLQTTSVRLVLQVNQPSRLENYFCFC